MKRFAPISRLQANSGIRPPYAIDSAAWIWHSDITSEPADRVRSCWRLDEPTNESGRDSEGFAGTCGSCATKGSRLQSGGTGANRVFRIAMAAR